jgi:hypothetical protein
MSLAIRVLNHIRKTREDLSRLRIFVRLYDPDKEAYIQKIADYYNEGYRHDCKKDEFKTDAIIIPFGKAGKIYSYEVIIREDLTERGKRFQRSYAEMKGESEFWDLRRKLLTGAAKKVRNELGKKVPVDVPLGERSVSLDDIRSLRRKEFQDLANALHADTKIDLLLRAMPDDYDWEDFFRRYFDENNKPRMEGSFDQIRYPLLNDFENQVVLNLARLEHLRWNASHEMLGYTKAGAGVHGCVERTREHNCLRPWQELDEEGRTVSEAEGWLADYKAFDFGVVDITLMLNKDRLLRRGE